MNHLWYFYLSAALITFLITLNKFMKQQDPSIPYRKSMWEFLTGSVLAEVTTVGTFAVVWLVGAIYIDDVAFLIGNQLHDVQPHPAIAAFLGFAGEYFTPRAIRWIGNMIFPGTGE